MQEPCLPPVGKSVSIEGNGVTLTRSASWTTVDSNSQLLSVYNSSAVITVNISGVHFMNGRATNYGAALYNNGGTVNLESCVFSGNRSSAIRAEGGAVYNSGTMNVKGCTFYNNSSGWRGGAVHNNSGTLTLTGNLFYGNTAIVAYLSPVVYHYGGTVTSNGYNVADVALGTSDTQSGWTAATGDATFSSLGITGGPFTSTFAPVSGLGAVMPSPALPDFPLLDFYGETRTWPGAPGAVKQ